MLKCWKYGHLIRGCPYKKIICPKCGSNHANCEILNFNYVNCGGDHMALDRPIYQKGKLIRLKMSEKNISYRKALGEYLESIRVKDNVKEDAEINIVENEVEKDGGPSYNNNIDLCGKLYAEVTKTRKKEGKKISDETIVNKRKKSSGKEDKVVGKEETSAKKGKVFNMKERVIEMKKLMELIYQSRVK